MMSDLLQHGIAVYQSGNKEEARKLFISFIKQNPRSQQGWEWMYRVSRNNTERTYCLQRIVYINPRNKKAIQLLEQFSQLYSRTGRNYTHISKNHIRVLTLGIVAGIFMVGICVAIAAMSPQWVRYNPHLGSNCFFLSVGGKQFCYRSVMPTQAVAYALSPLTTVFVTKPISSDTPTPVFTSTVTLASTITFTPTVSFTPTTTPTSTPDTRLNASLWRKWPIVPEFSPYAQNILREAAKNPTLNPHTFSKVGDCQMTAGTFLAGYANGKYAMPDEMHETIQWFSESMIADDLTAVNGYGINTVFDPAFGLSAGYSQCFVGETPLDCELRTHDPMIVLIGMGTNWIPHGETSFENYLRRIVDRVLEIGALPILATKADNVEGDWKLNQAIAQVAYDYDLPLVNVWLSVQDLPNHGLEKPPRQVYLTGDGWMKRNYAWLLTLDKARKIVKP